MDQKIELIKRNVEEVITEDELQALAAKKNPVVYCGYEPSGPIHLGHMVTVTKLMDLKEAGFKVKVLLADVHALLNVKGSEDFVAKQCKIWEKGIKAIGLDAEFKRGSDFQLKEEYVKDILALAIHTTITRGLRSMQEVARDVENAKISQIIYPLMQIIDMKHLGVDAALGGLEQRKIHMLAREVMEKINYKPPVMLHTPLIMSLLDPGEKMSSSIPNAMISVIDSEEQIKQKVSKAYCPAGDAENPVIQIAKLIVFPKTEKLKIERDKQFGGDTFFDNYRELERAFREKSVHPMDLKNAVAMELEKIIKPIRKDFNG